MKTTKKGFTLIELIVVIAIIGVLAAILVPAMLGYVKKSKIQSANSAAATILKAVNSALTEMDEVDMAVDDGDYNLSGGSFSDDADKVYGYLTSYFDGAGTATARVRIEHSVAIYCAAKSGTYYGTAPASFTAKDYDDTVTGADDAAKLTAAFEAASSKYSEKHAS